MFSASIIAVRAIGAVQPDSEAVRILGIKSCVQPCVMGITLGKTSYEEAERLLRAYQTPKGYQTQVGTFDDDQDGLRHLRIEWIGLQTVDLEILDFGFEKDRAI